MNRDDVAQPDMSKAELFLRLFDEYSKSIMHDALATIEQWERDNSDRPLSEAAERWANAVYLERETKDRDDRDFELNDARRLVVCYYHKLLALGENGFLDGPLLDELKGFAGRELLLGPVKELDFALEQARHGTTRDGEALYGRLERFFGEWLEDMSS